MEKREFFIDTPLGKLRVWAKHNKDTPEDFPGVFIDLVKDGFDEEMLCCVEYDSSFDRLQTCVYQPGHDEPESIIAHGE